MPYDGSNSGPERLAQVIGMSLTMTCSGIRCECAGAIPSCKLRMQLRRALTWNSIQDYRDTAGLSVNSISTAHIDVAHDFVSDLKGRAKRSMIPAQIVTGPLVRRRMACGHKRFATVSRADKREGAIAVSSTLCE